MVKLKLGELKVDKRVWIRKKLSRDQIRCLVNDLSNGATFPPLRVDRATKIIVDGNHRYAAYRIFYGRGWTEKEVEVELLDLPPFEENPAAWKEAALRDNQHDAERLRWGDRKRAAADLLDAGLDPESELAQKIARLLYFTPNSWREFWTTFFAAQGKPVPGGAAVGSRGQDAVKWENPAGDIGPEIANLSGPRDKLLRRARLLLESLAEVGPGGITKAEAEVLRQVLNAIRAVLEQAA